MSPILANYSLLTTYFVGIDAGSSEIRIVVIDGNEHIIGKEKVKANPEYSSISKTIFNDLLSKLNIDEEDIGFIISTGLGRYLIDFRNFQVTELTAAARGVFNLFPNTKTILDLGAQSTKCIKINSNGKIQKFKLNDKCAAGSGSFIAKAAKYLEISLEKIGDVEYTNSDTEPISCICAVLAESEIINRVTAGYKLEEIVCGIYKSLAIRSIALLKQTGIESEFTFIGGVAKQKGMVKALEEELKLKINVPKEPEYVIALGSALLAKDRFIKLQQ